MWFASSFTVQLSCWSGRQHLTSDGPMWPCNILKLIVVILLTLACAIHNLLCPCFCVHFLRRLGAFHFQFSGIHKSCSNHYLKNSNFVFSITCCTILHLAHFQRQNILCPSPLRPHLQDGDSSKKIVLPQHTLVPPCAPQDTKVWWRHCLSPSSAHPRYQPYNHSWNLGDWLQWCRKEGGWGSAPAPQTNMTFFCICVL